MPITQEGLNVATRATPYEDDDRSVRSKMKPHAVLERHALDAQQFIERQIDSLSSENASHTDRRGVH